MHEAETWTHLTGPDTQAVFLLSCMPLTLQQLLVS